MAFQALGLIFRRGVSSRLGDILPIPGIGGTPHVSVKIELVNGSEIHRAFQTAPSVVMRAVRQELKRAGSKFRTEAIKANLQGPPGIYLPALESRGRKGLFAKARARKGVQKAHIKAKTGGRTNPFLVAYGSRFLTFHSKKIKAPFESRFHQHVPGIVHRIEKEVARVLQRHLDEQFRRFRWRN